MSKKSENGFSIGSGALTNVMIGFPQYTEEQVAAARFTVAANAVDAEEAALFLQMLGLVRS